MRWITSCLLAVVLSPSLAADDARAIATYRDGLRSIVTHIEAAPRTALPTRQQREDARLLWKSFLDYELALETIRANHAGFYKAPRAERGHEFRLYHAAWLAQYRFALDLIARMEQHPEYHTILNESIPSLGLTSGSYSDFKLRWLNVGRAAEFGALALLDTTFGGKPLSGSRDDAERIVAAGRGAGTVQTFRNVSKLVEQAVWTPVPAGIEVAGGGPSPPAPRPSFISAKQIAEMRKLVKPGDLIFERREWALTNVGLPGFWPHIALYVGTPEQRKAMFGVEFEESLRAANPQRYASLSRATVIEALGEGVITTPFEVSADADFVGIARPRVPASAVQQAIRRAFALVGRPYDFEFDFATDDRIVCTELVYKAYEGVLKMPVLRIAGRYVTPANDIVRWMSEQPPAQSELDFVVFMDGQRKTRTAKAATADAFLASWQRPRWHSLKN